MRLRRLELAVIALTIAFICFMGGYFTGRRGAVSIVTVSSQNGETQTINIGSPQNNGGVSALPSAGEGGSWADSGVALAEDDSATGGGSATGGQPQEQPGVPEVRDGRININMASRSQLMDLPGIGSVLAERIVDYRQSNGPFSRIEDLRKVSGIGEKRFEAIEDKITVG